MKMLLIPILGLALNATPFMSSAFADHHEGGKEKECCKGKNKKCKLGKEACKDKKCDDHCDHSKEDAKKDSAEKPVEEEK